MIFLYIFLGIVFVLMMVSLIRFLMIQDRTSIEPMAIDEQEALTYAKKLAQIIQVKTLSYDETLSNDQPFIA
mgnify:CR=1 FL=1